MKKVMQFFLIFLLGVTYAYSQANPVSNFFPQGIVLHGNVPYNNDTLKKHLLDIYLPPDVKGKLPLVIFVHGGGVKQR